MKFRWLAGIALDQAAVFFAKAVALNTDYISHGEIQAGLSDDGKTWVDDLGGRLHEDITYPAIGQRVLGAYNDQDILEGVAIIKENFNHVVIEDLVTEPKSTGLGTEMIAFIEAFAKEEWKEWVFLESGIRNQRAHNFFERNGYELLSHTFGKKLRFDP